MLLCRALHQENGLFPLDEEKVRQMLRRAFNREGGLIGVIGPPGDLQAVIYMLLSTFWYSQSAHFEELFVYVRPEYRQTLELPEAERFSRVKALADFAKWCSDSSGIPLVIGVVSDARTAGKVALYERFFGKPVGSFFYYEAKKEKIAS